MKRTYEGFPDGISDEFCDHARRQRSAPMSVRALAAELFATRRELRNSEELRASLERRLETDTEIVTTLMQLASIGDAERFHAALKMVLGGAFISGQMAERRS
jgi:hypothetical protein